MVGKEIARTLDLSLGDEFVVKGMKYGQSAVASQQTFSAEENVKKDVGTQYFSRKLYVRGIITTGGAEEGFIFTDVDMLNELIDNTFRSDVVECSVMANAKKLGTTTARFLPCRRRWSIVCRAVSASSPARYASPTPAPPRCRCRAIGSYTSHWIT